MSNPTPSRSYLRKVSLRLVSLALILYCLASALLFWFQEYLIFPILLVQKVRQTSYAPPPETVTAVTVTTEDGHSLEGWTTYSPKTFPSPSHIALIFHGNGETIHAGNFLPFFLRHGVPAYSFDYRGYGNSTGWPSEELLTSDAQLVWKYLQQSTGIKNHALIILGNSLGTGIAASLARTASPKALFLIASYSSIEDVVATHPVYRWFSWLLRYRLPTAEYLANTNTETLVVAHGKNDRVIPYAHMEKVGSAGKQGGIQKVVLLTSETAGHNDIYYDVEGQLDEALATILRARNKNQNGSQGGTLW